MIQYCQVNTLIWSNQLKKKSQGKHYIELAGQVDQPVPRSSYFNCSYSQVLKLTKKAGFFFKKVLLIYDIPESILLFSPSCV